MLCVEYGAAAATAPRLLDNGSRVLALTVSFMGELLGRTGQWDAIV